MEYSEEEIKKICSIVDEKANEVKKNIDEYKWVLRVQDGMDSKKYRDILQVEKIMDLHRTAIANKWYGHYALVRVYELDRDTFITCATYARINQMDLSEVIEKRKDYLSAYDNRTNRIKEIQDELGVEYKIAYRLYYLSLEENNYYYKTLYKIYNYMESNNVNYKVAKENYKKA